MSSKKNFSYHYKEGSSDLYYYVNFLASGGLKVQENKMQDLKCKDFDTIKGFLHKVCNPSTAIVFDEGVSGWSVKTPRVETINISPSFFSSSTEKHNITDGALSVTKHDASFYPSSTIGSFSKTLVQIFKQMQFQPDNAVFVSNTNSNKWLDEFFSEGDKRYETAPKELWKSDIISLTGYDERAAKSLTAKLYNTKTLVLFDMKNTTAIAKLLPSIGDNAKIFFFNCGDELGNLSQSAKSLSLCNGQANLQAGHIHSSLDAPNGKLVVDLMKANPDANRCLFISDSPWSSYGQEIKETFDEAFEHEKLSNQKTFYSVNCEGWF